MTISSKIADSWVTVTRPWVRISSTWVRAIKVSVYKAGGWLSVWPDEVKYVNTANRTQASIYELMGSPAAPKNYIFENLAVISAGYASYALRTGIFPEGSTLTVINKGTIQGSGGAGGAYSGAGSPGGDAINADMDFALDTVGGYVIAGGGGGGGAWMNGSYYFRSAGGGGAGDSPGTAGSGSGSNSSGSSNSSPSAGSTSAGGVGAQSNVSSVVRTTGGNGGAPGVSGQAGTTGGSTTSYTRYAFAGGAAGRAVAANGFSVKVVSGVENIKGLVS